MLLLRLLSTTGDRTANTLYGLHLAFILKLFEEGGDIDGKENFLFQTLQRRTAPS